MNSYCDGLGLPRAVPARLLGWTKEGPPIRPEPELPPLIRELHARLRDPDIDAAEKYHIEQTILGLLRRRARPAPKQPVESKE